MNQFFLLVCIDTLLQFLFGEINGHSSYPVTQIVFSFFEFLFNGEASVVSDSFHLSFTFLQDSLTLRFCSDLGLCNHLRCFVLYLLQFFTRFGELFFDALFNLNKFIRFEQRDPFQMRQQQQAQQQPGAPKTAWDLFACQEYSRLAMEEEQRLPDMIVFGLQVG